MLRALAVMAVVLLAACTEPFLLRIPTLQAPAVGSTALALGTACSEGQECASGRCVDGVCCGEACAGACEACNVSGSEGRCAAVPGGTDPAHECGPKGTVNVELGDFADVHVGACAGVCNGQRACVFALADTPCGDARCSGEATTRSFACNGSGVCVASDGDCGRYACIDGSCRTNCAAPDHCRAADYCNVAATQCAARKLDGASCAQPYECEHDVCANPTSGATKLCCATQCNEPGMSCDAPGAVGTCSCGSITCANGCRLFYKDADSDAHGDEFGTLANGRALAGCVGTPMLTQGGFNWYPNDLPQKGRLDCDDNDAETFRGQTTGFDPARAHPVVGMSAYDFDCDGVETKTLAAFGNGCQVCTLQYDSTILGANFGQCHNTGQSSPCCAVHPELPNHCGMIRDPATQSDGRTGFTCGFDPATGQCTGKFVREGFAGNVECGQAGAWKVCGDCVPDNCGPNWEPCPPPQTTDPTKKMRCR